ncbi:MAG TPA: MFS transporter [Isosphaeraceae bacterium]|jgi:sugar phosphate permease|nr:MFS transporter [Isosphaeraceae bacterium]
MMARHELDQRETFAHDLEGEGPPSRVRYAVLAAACLLAIVTYLLRVGFATASAQLKGPLGLNSGQIAAMMASFMIVYGLFEIPWGLVADRLGVRKALAIIALGGSLTTAAVALVPRLPVGTFWPFAALLALRALFGMFQAGTFPALSRMMADWMPTAERGSAQGLIWMASRMGGALAPLLIAWLISETGSWSLPLVLASLTGLAWCAAFVPWFRDRPEQKVGVNPAERRLIEAGRKAGASGHGRLPWGRALASPNVWALCGMYGCLGFSGNFFLTMLPDYLKNHRHLSTGETSWLSALPLACGVVACVLGGVVSDRLILAWGDRRWARRVAGALGMAMAGAAVLATIAVRDVVPLGVLLCITFFGNDLAMGPAWAAAADIGERNAGTLGGMMNMFASFAGAAGAAMIGPLTDAHYLRLPFVIFAAVYWIGALCWLRVDVLEPLSDDDPAPDV